MAHFEDQGGFLRKRELRKFKNILEREKPIATLKSLKRKNNLHSRKRAEDYGFSKRESSGSFDPSI